jgi:short-subunit dehydrogenase
VVWLALITASSGLGFASAQHFVEHNAKVILACRDQSKAVAARDQLLATTPAAEIDVLELDLADLTQVCRGGDVAA